MNISTIAFHHRRVVFALLLVLMAFGFISYFTLPAQEDPHIIIREAVITTTYPGLPADRVELLITKTLEEAIRAVPEIEEIRSTSFPGRSVIHAEVYDRYFNLDQIWDEVRGEIDRVLQELPEGTGAPMVNDNFGDVAVVTAALWAEGFEMAELFDMAQHIRDKIYAIRGTKKVDILGAQEERIFIEFSNARLARMNVSPDELIGLLQRRNIIRPGGVVEADGKSFIIQPTGNYDTVDEIEATLIPLPGDGEIINLRDIGAVKRGYVDPPVRTAYFNGKQAIVFAVAMAENANVLDYGPRVKALLDETDKTLPAGCHLDIATYQVEQVENAVYGVTANVLQTLTIVLAVVILFLGVRTGLIVGAIVPSVMLVTLAIMNFNGMALERMSLATLIISLGLLVDNGIVIAEDFKRRLEEGESRDDALRNAGGTLAIPLLTSSLTTILVFLPLMLAEHVAGEYTRSISLVVLITLLASWVIALTVTPTLCHRFIQLKTDEEKPPPQRAISSFFERINVGYEKILRRIILWRGLFLILVGLLFFGSVFTMPYVPKKFFPDSDRTQVLVYLDLPAGTSMRRTDAMLRKMFAFLNDRERFPHVESYAAYGGFGGPRFVLSLTPIDPDESKGFLVLNIDRYENMDGTIRELRRLFSQRFPQVLARVTRMFLGPSDSSKIDIQVKGPDADYIYETAGKIKDILRRVPGVTDLKTDWENRITQIKVNVDQNRANRAGVTSDDIALSMEGYFSGRRISEFREGDDIFPIVARGTDDERFDLGRVRTVSVYSRTRNLNVPLMQVADIELVNNFARINRENLFRTVTVEAKNTVMTAEAMVPLIQPEIDALRAELPRNHTIEYDGVVKESGEAQAALSANAPICLGLMIILMLAQFNSFRRTLIIVMTLPLLLIGAVVGLLVMRANLGFMVTLGIYSLAGIIINNAIVLIDRIDIDRAEMDDPAEAVIAACVRRLRPIVMTTMTTIFGLMPLILSRDALFYGMASVIAFGLAVGTLLTLGVVPVLYTIFFGVKKDVV